MKYILLLSALFMMTACAHTRVAEQLKDGTAAPAPATPEDQAIQKLPGSNTDIAAGNTEINEIPVEVNSEVEKWIEYFQGRGRGYFERYLERSTRYIPIMKKILKENGVPEDLIYIAMIESGFTAKIKSRAKAVGFWQFIGGTGKHYGLRVSKLLDERYDPVRSTEAAAQYFKGLYNLFGSWYLAIASYNVGENRIKSMVMKNFTRNFWELARRKQLPAETTQYIPKFLAARLISNEPEKYGFIGLNYEEPLVYDTVTASDAVDMRVLAKQMRIDYSEVRDLNPSYKTQYAPVIGSNASVRVPQGTGEAAKLVMADSVVKNKRFIAEAPDTTPSKINFTKYKVKRGETLKKIADRFDLTVDDLLKVNRIRHNRVRPGMTLKIPSSAFNIIKDRKSYARHTPSTRGVASIYVVKRGDTLIQIAKHHEVSVSELIRKNKLTANGRVMRGQKLRIPRLVAQNHDES